MNSEEIQNDIKLAETLDVSNSNDTQQETQHTEVEQQVVGERSGDSINNLRFKTVRENWEREKQENSELRAELARLKAQSTQVQQQSEQSQDYSLAPDDFVEGKHLTREIKKIREEVKKYQEQALHQSIDGRLHAKYPDFSDVVNRENIDMLAKVAPEIVMTLDQSPDLYNKAVSAYTLIKRFGFADAKKYEKEHAAIENNALKPRSISSISGKDKNDSPLSHANAFSDGNSEEARERAYREMKEAQNNY